MVDMPIKAATPPAWRREVLTGALTAIAGLPGRHASERFELFVTERELTHSQRDALFRVVMLRSEGCLKDLAYQKSDATMILKADSGSAPVGSAIQAEVDCFCCSCCGPTSSHLPKKRPFSLAAMLVYPGYDWYPPPTPTGASAADAMSEEDVQVERAVHRYLVRLRKLPQPLPDLYRPQSGALRPDLKRAFGVELDLIKVKDDVSRPRFFEKLVYAAGQSDTLLLVLTGHGHRGALLLSTGDPVKLIDVRDALRTCGFRGTAVCVLNVCHAEGGPEATDMIPPGGLAGGPSDLPSEQLPFNWVVIYSSGPEVQVASHAMHVARLLARLIREAPTYKELQDRADALWAETRDAEQMPTLWRGPPNVVVRHVDAKEARFLRAYNARS
jgi:hypothetical protein